MGERVTVVIDADVMRKLRAIQSKLIVKSPKSVIFSRVLNNELRKQLK